MSQVPYRLLRALANFIGYNWDGVLTGKNLLSQREQILFCMKAISNYWNEVKVIIFADCLNSIPFHSISCFKLCHVTSLVSSQLMIFMIILILMMSARAQL